MTIEEKARAYDSIIEKANKMHSENCEACKVCIEELIPELAESEDEKIRKELISYIKQINYNNLHTWNGINLNVFIAWLEKQGTPAKLSEEEQNEFAKCVLTSCALSFIDYLDAHKYEGKMCVSNGECEDIENAFHNAMWDRLHRYYCKYIGNQGEQETLCDKCRKDHPSHSCQDITELGRCAVEHEQKPAAWSEGDKRSLTIKDVISELEKIHNITKMDDDCYTGISKAIYTLKTINEHQLKQEWSEEDEAKLKSILFHIEDVENKDVIDWLKSIKDRVHPKQKWDEKDEMMLSLIIDNLKFICDTISHDDKYVVNVGSFEGQIDWLKSLKSQIDWLKSLGPKNR